MDFAEYAHDAPDRTPVAAGSCGRGAASCARGVCLLPVGVGQLSPGQPRGSVYVAGTAVCGEITTQPIRRVVREAAALSQGAEAKGVADSKETSEAVVG